MLVLTRKASESIVIDGSIVVTVVKIEGNKVKLGVAAPPNVSIFRDEIAPTKPPVTAQASVVSS